MPKSCCPVCKKELDQAENLDDKKLIPEPQDITVCFGCTSFLQFDENLQLKELTDNEVADLDHDIKMELIKLRRVICSIKT